jgi:hypothetical protein
MFLEKLRNARHLPLRTQEHPERFELSTQSARAEKTLDRPVTLNYHEPIPLAKILAFLARAAKCEILVDHAALAAAETSDRVETSLTVENKTLRESLEKLLPPLGLAYRAIGPNLIQVTTKEAAGEKLEVEFYPVEPLLDKKNSPRPLAGEGPGVREQKLVERLKSEIAPATWNDTGGQGEIYFDAPSQCLIVLQSQPIQAAVERLLVSLLHR